MVRRIGAILLMQSALNVNYPAVKENTQANAPCVRRITC
jgi:hypothetical protein